MRDPKEGLTAEGFIRTGVRRDRVAGVFEPVIEAAQREVKSAKLELLLDSVALYLYGSVATGAAVPPASDVDFLTIGLPTEVAARLSRTLSGRFMDICRGVEVAAATSADFVGEADDAYGGRIFLRHYCVLLYGSDVVLPGELFRGDTRAARGFNGDIAYEYVKWCTQIEMEPGALGRRVARKLLLAVAGLVSLHDHTWTTDRESSGLRWAALHPEWRPALDTLMRWSEGNGAASRVELTDALSADGIACAIVDSFRAKIGLWGQG